MSKLQKILFIDRDGTLIKETTDEQIDSFAKLEFYPKILQYLPRIAAELDYELVMVTNQDGLGTRIVPRRYFLAGSKLYSQNIGERGCKFLRFRYRPYFPA